MDFPIPEEAPVINTVFLGEVSVFIRDKDAIKLGEIQIQKMASDPHHTATTAYPCCVPALGDSAGAGCVGLAGANIQSFLLLASNF